MLLGLFVVRSWATGQTENFTMTTTTKTTMNLTSPLELTEMLCKESQVSIIRLVVHSQRSVVGDEKSLHEWQLWLLAASLSPQWHFVMKNKWREIKSCTKSDSFFLSPSFCVCATSTWLSSQVNCKQNALCVFFVLSTIPTLRFLYYCLYYAVSPSLPRTCTSALHLLW